MKQSMESPVITTMKQSMQVLVSMSTSRWYTPSWYIKMVHQALGFIDLDPASESSANEIVKATRYYTEYTNGLVLPWMAETIFLNPPYSKEGERKATTPKWINRALDEYHARHYDKGIILVNAKLGYKWFNNIIDYTYTTVILHRNRMGFIDAKTMKESKPSRQPQASIFIGQDNDKFIKVFSELGWIVG